MDAATGESGLIREVFEACAQDDRSKARTLILTEVTKTKRIQHRDDVDGFLSFCLDEIQALRHQLRERGWEEQLGEAEGLGPESYEAWLEGQWRCERASGMQLTESARFEQKEAANWVSDEKRIAHTMHLLLERDPLAPLPPRMRGIGFEEGIKLISRLLKDSENQFRWARTFIRRLQSRS